MHASGLNSVQSFRTVKSIPFWNYTFKIDYTQSLLAHLLEYIRISGLKKNDKILRNDIK